jgi:hypothetical protein
MGSNNSQPEANSQPVQPTVQPVQPTVQPVQHTVQPIQHTVQPVQQTVQPTVQPTVQRVQPSIQPMPAITKSSQNTAYNNLNNQPKMYQLPFHKQSRQEIYQNRPRVQTIQTCSGCSSNINSSSRIIQQNTNHINQSKPQCNAALQHICPCNSVKHVNNCIRSNLDCNCNNCNSNIYIKNRCNCNSCNSDQNNSICISRNNAVCNSSKTCNNCCAHIDSSCLYENKIKPHRAYQDDYKHNFVVQSDTCSCGDCIQDFDANYDPKYAEYFNQTNENNNSQTLVCEENQSAVENICSNNYNNTNQTNAFYSIPNVPPNVPPNVLPYGSNDNSHIISQQSNAPLNQSLLYLPPPTNLGKCFKILKCYL